MVCSEHKVLAACEWYVIRLARSACTKAMATYESRLEFRLSLH